MTFILLLGAVLLIVCGYVTYLMWDMPVEYRPTLMGDNPIED